MKVYFDFLEKDKFYENMVLAIEEIEFNSETQMMEAKVKHCKSYDDL